MPEWLWGVIAAAAGPGLLMLWAMLAKRVNVYSRCYKWGSALRSMGMGYDIPVIGGDAETGLKDRILSFVSDGSRGFARGIAGKPEVEEKVGV